MIKNFINLTSGLEWLPLVKPDGFVRIQSTWLEQKRWWPIIHDLDYAFLLAVAMGHDVVVYDTSAHKHESRAIYQGLPWIGYVLNRTWLGNHVVSYVRSHNVTNYFKACYDVSDNVFPAKAVAMRKLKYIARITSPSRVSIMGKCMKAGHDGDYDWYRKENKT